MIKSLKRNLYHWLEKKYLPGCSNYNTLEVRRNTRAKSQGRDKFAENNIPQAKGFVFFNPLRALKFVGEYGFPVVIKPNVSGFSRGSYFPINTYKELWAAIFWARFWWPKTVIEQYGVGGNYRITVLDGEIIAACRRYPPHVIGDGKSQIIALINQENSVRETLDIYPVMYPIRFDGATKKYLKKQGLTLESVLEKNQKVDLFHRVALAPGGVVETLDVSKITDKNKALMVKILDIFEARVFGIDLIMEEGPYADWDKQKCIVLEVNSRPVMTLHENPRFGERPDLGAYYEKLDRLEIADADVF